MFNRNCNRRRRRIAQRGMTLLEIMIVLAILALVMGLVVGPRVMKMFGESKVDIARMTVQKYANEAYPPNTSPGTRNSGPWISSSVQPFSFPARKPST